MSGIDSSAAPWERVPERLWALSEDLMGVADMEGRLLAVNRAWSDVLGWSQDQVLANTSLALVHPDDLPLVRASLTRVGEGEISIGNEVRLRRRDGTYRCFSWRTYAGGGHVYIVGRDLTDRLKQDEALRYAQKMEAVAQLTGGVAHDFNNLLTIVRSSIEFLKRPDLPKPRRERYVGAIDEAVERATKITQQLLAFARRQRLEPQLFEVTERIAEVTELLRQIVGPGVRVESLAPEAPGYVEADISQFEIALMNLVTNARDAMGGDGVMTIRSTLVHQMQANGAQEPVTGDFVAISVCDTGAGIPPEQHAHIFEPFFTTKDVGRGAGLGLSQVYGFATQSGGGVSVRSQSGEGTEVTLYLPRSNPAARPAMASTVGDARPAQAPAQDCGVVLVVEDNDEVGRFCSGMMRDLGYSPRWARNAHEALDLLERGVSTYDLVFSDVVMPGMSGIELAKQVRSRWPRLPIVLTSGYSPVLAEQGAGGFPLLAKPYSASELQRALAAVSPGAAP